MKFKLDENLPAEAAELLRNAGHDALTVYDQTLNGKDDGRVAEVCRAEKRALITADTDFCDLRTYPPHDYSGFVVLRLRRQDKPHVLNAIGKLISWLGKEQPDKRLWIVEEHRLRIRGEEMEIKRS